MITINNMTKSFNNKIILKDISLTIPTKQVCGIIGPSGSGKSTILRTICGLEAIDYGEILIDGQDIGITKSMGRGNRQILDKITMVFQHFNLFPQWSVGDNIINTLMLTKKLSREAAQTIAKEKLTLVGLKNFEHRAVQNLSGGQKQRVAIARALAMNPEILLFDEPTSALDPESVNEVLDIIRQLKTLTDTTIIIVSHQLEFIKEVCDYTYLVENGQIVESNTNQQLFNTPQHPRTQAFLATYFNKMS